MFLNEWKIGYTSSPSLYDPSCVHACVLRCVQLFMTQWTLALPCFSAHGIFQAGILAELPFPPPRHLPGPGIKPESPAWQVHSLPLSHQGSLIDTHWDLIPHLGMLTLEASIIMSIVGKSFQVSSWKQIGITGKYTRGQVCSCFNKRDCSTPWFPESPTCAQKGKRMLSLLWKTYGRNKQYNFC